MLFRSQWVILKAHIVQELVLESTSIGVKAFFSSEQIRYGAVQYSTTRRCRSNQTAEPSTTTSYKTSLQLVQVLYSTKHGIFITGSIM